MKKDQNYHKALLEEFSEAIQDSEFRKVITKFHFRQVFKNHKIKDGFHNQYVIGYEKDYCNCERR